MYLPVYARRWRRAVVVVAAVGVEGEVGGRAELHDKNRKEVKNIYNHDVSRAVILKYLESLRETWGHYIDSASGERRRVDGQAVSLLLLKSTCFHDICDSDGATTQEDLICPISRAFLQDPVECSDGHTYERNDIEKHFKLALDRGKPCESPMSRQILDAQKGEEENETEEVEKTEEQIKEEIAKEEERKRKERL
jgi:hypothetical protein